MDSQNSVEHRQAEAPENYRRATLKSLGLAVLALLAGKASIGSARAQSEMGTLQSGAPKTASSDKPSESLTIEEAIKLVKSDPGINSAATLGALQQQLSGQESAFDIEILYDPQRFVIILPPRLGRLEALPKNLKIEPGMNLAEALSAVKASEAAAQSKGLVVTKAGLKLVR